MNDQEKRVRRTGTSTLTPIVQGASRDARRIAAAILEVLAGARTPMQAAESLAVSLTRYYVFEARALTGMVGACEPQPTRRGRSSEREIERLRRQVQQLEREAMRYRTLARTTQRALGLAAPTEPSGKGKRRRSRRPTVRALKAVGVLHSELACPVSPPGGAGAQDDRS